MAKVKYPTVFTSESKKDDVESMSPKKFLKKARKLNIGSGDRKVIDSFKKQIKAAEPLSPVKLLKGHKEDGRHRATAAKELGIKDLPVINERKKKAFGGALASDDPNLFMRRAISYAFAIAPLANKGRPGTGFALGGRTGYQLKGGVEFMPDDEAQAIDTARDLNSGAFGESAAFIPPAPAPTPKVEEEKTYEPFGVLPFSEDKSGIHFDPNAGLLGHIISGLTLPGDVVTGKVDPTSDKGIERALDLAGVATSGSTFGTRPAGALASGASRPEKPLMAIHNTLPMHIMKASETGGIAAPSTAIREITSPYTAFGNVSLIGDRSFAEPNKKLSLYGGDAFTQGISGREASAEDLVKDIERKSRTIGVNDVYNIEEAMGYLIPQIHKFEDLKKRSHLLSDEVSSDISAHDLFRDKARKILEELKKYENPKFKEKFKNFGASPLVDPYLIKDYYKNVPESLQNQIYDLHDAVKEIKQPYFESKYWGVANAPNKKSDLNYQGAIVPAEELKRLSSPLSNLGIKEDMIVPLETEDPQELIRAYDKFKHLYFSSGGEVLDSTYTEENPDPVNHALNLVNSIHRSPQR